MAGRARDGEHHLGPEAAAVPNLILPLNDQDPVIRQRALTALYTIGPTATPAVEALEEALKDTPLDNSSRAADGLVDCPGCVRGYSLSGRPARK